MIQDGPEDVPNPALAGAGDSSKETNSGGRGTAQQSASVNKPVDKMKLHFLKNTLVTCNDGTAVHFNYSLLGGWCCYNKEACDSRYKTGSQQHILLSFIDENPHWYNANIVCVPYCSSDVWSANKAASKSKQVKETDAMNN
uniref:Uncharacterized protein n=1 Tax=Cyprinus carpio TaxID=7962 RepID=A0A8C2BE72_CYPCA